MTLSEVKSILDAQLFCGEELLGSPVNTACGSDMMSDVLAYVKDQAVLLTGLMNQQVIRTAEMMDMVCIVFVRGKMPDQSIIVSIDRQGEIIIPRGNTCVYSGDKLLIMAKNSVLHKVKDKLRLDD